mmetsp:Transcript_23381/g.69614  ORF Transcript_23381/g.69614 Transcript_23381/m.69614 type:complete len:218 (+) Transcript_23381:90-743(+)
MSIGRGEEPRMMPSIHISEYLLWHALIPRCSGHGARQFCAERVALDVKGPRPENLASVEGTQCQAALFSFHAATALVTDTRPRATIVAKSFCSSRPIFAIFCPTARSTNDDTAALRGETGLTLSTVLFLVGLRLEGSRLMGASSERKVFAKRSADSLCPLSSNSSVMSRPERALIASAPPGWPSKKSRVRHRTLPWRVTTQLLLPSLRSVAVRCTAW